MRGLVHDCKFQIDKEQELQDINIKLKYLSHFCKPQRHNGKCHADEDKKNQGNRWEIARKCERHDCRVNICRGRAHAVFLSQSHRVCVCVCAGKERG